MDNILFLVNCEIITSYYMDDNDKKAEATHIVEAIDEEEAMSKVRKFYENKDSEYSISHWVNFNYINKMIR